MVIELKVNCITGKARVMSEIQHLEALTKEIDGQRVGIKTVEWN